MPNRQYIGTNYRYGFSGKGKDDEVKGGGNSIDFGARVYDSRLGRFFSVDPWTQKYPWNTAYSYADNKVIDHIDIDGKGTGSFMRPITMSWEIRASAMAQKYVKEGTRPRDAYIRAHLEVALAGSAVVVAGAAL